jgi:hypothetical protein
VRIEGKVRDACHSRVREWEETCGKEQILGLVRSAVLFIGVFTPIVGLPIVGTRNYFQNGQGDAVIVLVLALISLLLTLAKRYRGLRRPGPKLKDGAPCPSYRGINPFGDFGFDLASGQ